MRREGIDTKSAGIDTEMVPFEIAQSILANAISALASEQISLSDALGRVAAENIVAEEDLALCPISNGRLRAPSF